MRLISKTALAVALATLGGASSFASPTAATIGNVLGATGLHAQVVVVAPGPVGWYRGRYWDGNRYWARREWYAAHPGWNGGWGPGWRYNPGVVAPGVAVGWYGGRYYDGHRYWVRREWYAAHPGWRGGWGPGWHYRP